MTLEQSQRIQKKKTSNLIAKDVNVIEMVEIDTGEKGKDAIVIAIEVTRAESTEDTRAIGIRHVNTVIHRDIVIEKGVKMQKDKGRILR